MKNLSKHLNRIVNVLSSIKPGKTSGQWSFLFVKESGEIISIDRFKELVVILVVVMAITFATITGFYVLYKKEKGKNENLKKALTDSKQKIAALQDKKDVLMVRLVLAESKVKDQQPDLKDEKNEPSTEMLSNGNISATENTNTDGTKKTVLSETKDTTETITKPEILTVVDAEDVDVFHDTNKNILRVKFILRKTDPAIKTVSGRAFVVLKSNKDEMDPLVLPSVSLTSGKPSQIRRGQYFSIAHFKWMKFEKKFYPTAESFQYVTVFAFTTEGELLLEKEIAI